MITFRDIVTVTDESEKTVIGDTVAIETPELREDCIFSLIKIVKEARKYKDPATGKVYTCLWLWLFVLDAAKSFTAKYFGDCLLHTFAPKSIFLKVL